MTRAWIALFLLLPAGGCAYQSMDMRRPLSVATIPTSTVRVRAIAADFGIDCPPRGCPEHLAKSMSLTRVARNRFDTHRHNDWSTYVNIRDLGNAIYLLKENAFAWVQLGAYLALDHQFEAAIFTTEEGLRLVDELCGDGVCSTELAALKNRATINLALIHASADRPRTALHELRRLAPSDLPPFERLAHQWTAADVRSALGDHAGALDAMRAAAAVPESRMRAVSDLPGDYPQYFGEHRQAIDVYLCALDCYNQSDMECARAIARDALTLDRRLWDAKLLLANVEMADGNHDAAITELQALARVSRAEVFRPERIHFNLGNAYMARHDRSGSAADLDAAIDAFEEAAEIVRKRFERSRRQIQAAEVIRLENAGPIFMDSIAMTPPVYAEALNNLGAARARRAALTEKEADRIADASAAEEAWRTALRDLTWNRRDLAYANLARHHAAAGRIDAAADAAHSALEENPSNFAPIDALVEAADVQDDPSVAIDAAHAAALLVYQRRSLYGPGALDDIFRLAELRLNRTKGEARDRAAAVLRLAKAKPDAARAVLDELLMSAPPDWLWPRLELARLDLEQGRDPDAVFASLPSALAAESAPENWIRRTEFGTALALRAADQLRQGRLGAARRAVERAVAAGVPPSSIDATLDEIDRQLEEKGEPAVASLAVLPFDAVHVSEPSWSTALATSLSLVLRGSGVAQVRSFERDPSSAAEWGGLSPIDIGRRSGVGGILTGRIARDGLQMIVDVSVYDSIAGKKIWSERYIRNRDNLMAIQGHVAEEMFRALRIRPRVDPKTAASETFTTDPDAYKAYLDAMDILLTRTKFGRNRLNKARFRFERAVGHDEEFVRAWAGMAMAGYELANVHVRSLEAMPEAKRAAEKAVALDPKRQVAEAQLALALIRTWYDWDLEAGGAAFRKAIDLDPYNATTHRLFGTFLTAVGRFDEALEQKRKAAELAPLSAVARLDVGRPLFYLRRYDEALAQADAAIALQPRLASAHEFKGWIYAYRGRYDLAADALRAAKRHASGDAPPTVESLLALVEAKRGNSGSAKTYLGLLEGSDRYILPLLKARVHLALGDRPKAMQELRKAFNDCSESMVWLHIDPWFEEIRETPEFQALVKRVKPRACQ